MLEERFWLREPDPGVLMPIMFALNTIIERAIVGISIASSNVQLDRVTDLIEV